MRVLAFACALLAATSVARADDSDEDDEDDEDAAFVALPAYSIGILVGGHGTRIGGHSETGFGPSLELALGRGRWQYFIEGGIATSGMDQWSGGQMMRVDGRLIHGGLGARWLARQFLPSSRSGVELYLLSRAGLEQFSLDRDTRLTRAELALGFGMQVRHFKRPRITVRLDARVLYTPNDPDDALVACTGNCAAEAGSSTGFATGLGLAW